MKTRLNKNFYNKEDIYNAKDRFKGLLRIEVNEKDNVFEIDIMGPEKEAREFLNHCLAG